MNNNQNLLFIKERYLFGLMMLLFVFLICVGFKNSDDDFAVAKREILLRRIGHELLLQSGDSTSRVLPVKKITENEYQIRFQNELAFQPEALVKIVRRFLAKDARAEDYVINVLNCSNSTVTYGFVVSKNKKEDIISCLGRKQPKACYIIDVKFKPTNIITTNNKYLLIGLPLLAFGGFIFFKSLKSRKRSSESSDIDDDKFNLGSVLFDVKNKRLITNEKTIELTGTESRVLLIFALSPNETIERSRLQKEIWEDEGVIVGRSLDMFVSKLRKKLEVDPNVKIVVVRSKGYKLEINS